LVLPPAPGGASFLQLQVVLSSPLEPGFGVPLLPSP
jgi:hypothetical protein